MKKIITVLSFLLFASIAYSQSFTGNYFIGEQKASISVDENYYYIIYEADGLKRVLKYEENTPENDQIWLEYLNAKQTGTLVVKQDYSTGVYTDYRSQKESLVKRRDE